MANEQTVRPGGVGLPKGSKIGKYEVVERIGMGGQAVVYKCYDPLLDRYVATKQISAHLAADPGFLDRFRKEARILAKLGNEQESIVTIHELIEDEQGLFIVMEYLSGPSLEAVLQDTNGPSEPKAVLQIIWRLAAALHAVHSAGIIHRDLKPSNIIVCEGLRAKITDFGVAAMSGDASMPLGTTKYMAPELYEDVKKVDGRVDMYSLGFIAYELLAGRPKFDEIFADIIRDKHGEQLRWMKWHGNPAVAAPLLHEINPAVPVALSNIVARMMDKDPDQRFGSMEELGRAVKTTFSPRAKSAAGAAQAARLRRRVAMPQRLAVAAGAPAGLTAEDSGAPLVPRDEGDELEVTSEGAATAPIPSARIGRKVLLFFLLPLVLLLILGGVTAGVIHLVQQRQAEEAAAQVAVRTYQGAEKAMKAGLLTYDAARFIEATDGFADLQKRFPASPLASQAWVLQPLCEAYLAVAKGEWQTALNREAAVAERAKRVQATRNDLGEWCRKAPEYVRNFHSYYVATRTFRETIERAEAEFARQQYDEARLIIRRDLRDVSCTPRQDEEIRKFLEKVDLTEFRGLLEVQIRKADDFAQQRKFPEAEEAYQKAQEMLQSERAAVLPADEGKTYELSVRNKLKDLTANQTLRDAQVGVQKAREGGEKRLLVIALKRLMTLEPDEAKIKEYREEVNTLQAEILLEQAREAKAGGRNDQARQLLQQSLAIKETKEARDELAILDRSDQRASMIGAGDALFAAAKWAEALAEYEKAAKLQMDETLQAKMIECQFRTKLQQADQLRAEKKYDEAAKAYQEAKAAKSAPAAAALIDARLELMAADRKYEKLMEEGYAALKREQWVAARDFFQQAQPIRNTDQVKEAIAETRYQENKARGQEAMDQRDWNGALGYLKLARSFKDTEEIRGLIARVEQEMRKAAG